MTCTYCERELVGQSHYHRVQAWERPGRGFRGKSGSSLVLREAVPDVYACAECIARKLYVPSVHPEQMEIT